MRFVMYVCLYFWMNVYMRSHSCMRAYMVVCTKVGRHWFIHTCTCAGYQIYTCKNLFVCIHSRIGKCRSCRCINGWIHMNECVTVSMSAYIRPCMYAWMYNHARMYAYRTTCLRVWRHNNVCAHSCVWINNHIYRCLHTVCLRAWSSLTTTCTTYPCLYVRARMHFWFHVHCSPYVSECMHAFKYVAHVCPVIDTGMYPCVEVNVL